MSTSEYRSVDAESDLPISAAELAALASQLYAASIRPGPDSPPQTAPVAPRGSVPDTTAATRPGRRPRAPPICIRRRFRCSVSPTSMFRLRRLPEPERAAADGAGRPARQRARHDGGALGRAGDRQRRRSLPGARLADLSAFAVPSAGIVPTVPGCAGRDATEPFRWPRAVRPDRWLPEAPSVADLGWSDAPAHRSAERAGR